MSAGIYTRISEDDGTSTAPERQEADCRALAATRGFTVSAVYEDRDTSAFDKKVKRPAFERLVGDVARGEIDTVLCWKSDRLARQPRDLEKFIDALERHKAALISVTEPEFSGAGGLLMLRMLVNFASHESSVKSERIIRKSKEMADSGHPHIGGRRAYGYTAQFEPMPDEAAIFVEAVERLLLGERINAITADFNARGVKPITAERWSVGSVTRMLRAPCRAGLRAHHDRIIPGTWTPLIDVATWERVQAVLDDRTRTWGYVKTVTKHALTGIAVCGSCGAPMNGTSRGQRQGRQPIYRCNTYSGGCGNVSIDRDKLERTVTERFLHVVGTPDFSARLAIARGKTPHDIEAMLQLIRRDEDALVELTNDYSVEHIIPRASYLVVRDRLEERIRKTRKELAAQSSASAPLVEQTGGDFAVEWDRRDPAWRRSVLETVVRRIVVAPARSRYEDRVTIEWII